MINYTEHLARLVQDIVSRVPALAFIDLAGVLVFARPGRTRAEGAFATCHSLNLPPSEPGYHFWRDRRTGKISRRSEWFVTKSPRVEIHGRRLQYLISFVLPRFCDQTLARAQKDAHYPGADHWLAKLDTVVHELYHIDPSHFGIRTIERADGTRGRHSHGRVFFERVAQMVKAYLATSPCPEVYAFLRHDFVELNARFGGVVATTFRTFPSFPERYVEVLPRQPRRNGMGRGKVERVRLVVRPTRYTEADLCLRQFHARWGTQSVGKNPGSTAEHAENAEKHLSFSLRTRRPLR